MTCCVCKREREPFKVIVLTEEERTAVSKLSKGPVPDQFVYCKSCWKVASDKVQGPQLLKGMLQVQFQRTGVQNPEVQATRVRDFVIKKSAPKPVS